MKKCEQCGCEINPKYTRRKFCDDCTTRRRRELQREWARLHSKPRTKDQLLEQYAHAKEKQRECHARGAEIGASLTQQTLLTFCKDKPSPKVIVSFCIPFTYDMSKNHIWSNRFLPNGRGTVYKRDEARAQEQVIIGKLSSYIGSFRKNKIWVDIFVEKPDNRGDAVNFVDLVCDAIKKGIDVDDRWFSLGSVDWRIVKGREPQVFIRVYQEDNWDGTVCSYCGRILPRGCFRGQKGRECKECLNNGYRFSDNDLKELLDSIMLPEWYSEESCELDDEQASEIIRAIANEKLYGQEINIKSLQ